MDEEFAAASGGGRRTQRSLPASTPSSAGSAPKRYPLQLACRSSLTCRSPSAPFPLPRSYVAGDFRERLPILASSSP